MRGACFQRCEIKNEACIPAGLVLVICDKGAERVLILSEEHYTIRHLDRAE